MLSDFADMNPWKEVGLLLLLSVVAWFVYTLLCCQPLSLISYVFYLVVVGMVVYKYRPDPWPAPVFWLLVIEGLPFAKISIASSRSFGPGGNMAGVAVWALFLSNWTHVTALLHIIASTLFVLLFVFAWPMPFIAFFVVIGAESIVSPAALPPVLVTALVMHTRFHFFMHPVYWIVWPFLVLGFGMILPSHSPPVWIVLVYALVAVLGWLTDPARWTEGFLLFTLSVYAVGPPWFLFQFVYLYPETYVFPFNLVARWHKVPSAVWSPIGRLEHPPNILCMQCSDVTSKSRLIMGSHMPLISLTELYGVSFKRSSLVSVSPCDLCPLIWNSVSIEALRDLPDEGWKIKVWQTRPLSRYTFAKLYHEDKPLGLRLLIHRGKTFKELAISTKSTSTDSSSHLSLAKSWLAQCTAYHGECGSCDTNTIRGLPTRLIRVQKPRDDTENLTVVPKIRLIITDARNDADIKYLALSHCWGGTSTLRLLKGNVERLQSDIDVKELSQNVRDAVVMTYKLGYAYIWIDSLCIIQDSAEDWNEEAARMRSVYEGAACTLASTGSASGDGGLFHSRAGGRSLQPCRIGVSSRGISRDDDAEDDTREWIYVRRDDLSDFRCGVDNAPLNARGWVLQERLLSRRLLHFGSEGLYWECRIRAASELCPDGFIYKMFPEEYYGNYLPFPNQAEPDGSDLEPVIQWDRQRIIQRRLIPPDLDLVAIRDGSSSLLDKCLRRTNREFLRETRRHTYTLWWQDNSAGRYRTALDQIRAGHLESEGLLSFPRCWYTIVEPYTRSRLSFSSDTLIAIKGLVDEVQRVTGYHFIAGVWQEHLVECLLWFVTQGPGRRRLETAVPKTASQTTAAPPMPGPQMAPSWSWASVEAVVTIDQLPTNASRKVRVTSLATACSATAMTVPPGAAGEQWRAVQGVLEIEAPLTKIARLERVDGNDRWYIHAAASWVRGRSAQFIPDLVDFADDATDLYCVSLLTLRRDTELMFHIYTYELQGIVLKHLQKRDGQPAVYERVGFFTTGRVKGGPWRLRQLVNAPAQKIHIV